MSTPAAWVYDDGASDAEWAQLENPMKYPPMASEFALEAWMRGAEGWSQEATTNQVVPLVDTNPEWLHD